MEPHLATLTQQAVKRATERLDFNRTPWHGAAPSSKEWVHVVLCLQRATLLINFSRLGAPPVVRLTTVLFDGNVRGSIRPFDAEHAQFPGGSTRIVAGESSITLTGRGYALELAEPALRLRARLLLKPVTLPTITPCLGAEPSSSFHWLVVARARVSGAIELDGRKLSVNRALAYKDRNWGNFEFGAGAAWDWGFVLPERPAEPRSIVWGRLYDASRTQVKQQELLLWEHSRLVALFRDDQISVAARGRARLASVPTFPPSLSLCQPGNSTGVPAELELSAVSSKHELKLRFEPRGVARLVVPRDRGHGTSILHESWGRCEVSGGFGQPFRGTGFLEQAYD